MIPTLYASDPALVLRACRTDKFKAGMLSVSAVLPVRRESAWMITLLISVLRRGTVKYPTLAVINRRLELLFGVGFSMRNFYRGDAQVFGFSADLLENRYLPAGAEDLTDGVTELVDEILFHPLLDENGLLNAHYVESEKEMQRDAIRALCNNPRSYAAEHCRASLYCDEPCGAPINGTEEEVMAVTPEALTAFWRELISGITLECFYIGGEDGAKLYEKLIRAFPELRGHTPAAVSTAVIPSAKTIRRVEESLPVSQGQLVIALRGGVTVADRDYYACNVMNELLGVSPVSRLFVYVREKKSLCYFCSSSYDQYKGTFLIRCGLDPANRDDAEREIFFQLGEVAKGNFSDTELDAAKKSLLNSYRQLEDTPAAVESFYAGRAFAGVETSLEESIREFLAVTRDDIVKVASKLTTDTVYFLNGTLTGEADDREDD